MGEWPELAAASRRELQALKNLATVKNYGCVVAPPGVTVKRPGRKTRHSHSPGVAGGHVHTKGWGTRLQCGYPLAFLQVGKVTKMVI